MFRSSRTLASAAAITVLMAAGSAHAFTVIPFTGTQGQDNNANVPLDGYPDFWSYGGSATLTQAPHAGNFTFTYTDIFNLPKVSNNSPPQTCATCAAVFNFPSGAYAVQNLNLTLTATFDKSGNFLSGNYSIAGSVPGSASPTYGTAPSGLSWTSSTSPLFTASLTGANVDLTNKALGFTTSSFGGWANQPQFTGGSTSESVWLYSQLTCQTANQSSPFCTNNTSYSFWNSFLAQLKNKNLNVTGSFSGLASIATVPIPAAVLLFGSGLAGLGRAFRRRGVVPAAA
jgi:hypothetical protein